jgi:hypothetical protein
MNKYFDFLNSLLIQKFEEKSFYMKINEILWKI